MHVIRNFGTQYDQIRGKWRRYHYTLLCLLISHYNVGHILWMYIQLLWRHFICSCSSELHHWGQSCHCVEWLWLSDDILRHRTGTTLNQVMAYCHTASSHHLDHCWLIVKCVLWGSPECPHEVPMNFVRNMLGDYTLKFPPHIAGTAELRVEEQYQTTTSKTHMA